MRDRETFEQTKDGDHPPDDAGEAAGRDALVVTVDGEPLKVLCELGGWKTAKTVLQCYQRADEGQLRQALANRRRVRT